MKEFVINILVQWWQECENTLDLIAFAIGDKKAAESLTWVQTILVYIFAMLVAVLTYRAAYFGICLGERIGRKRVNKIFIKQVSKAVFLTYIVVLFILFFPDTLLVYSFKPAGLMRFIISLIFAGVGSLFLFLESVQIRLIYNELCHQIENRSFIMYCSLPFFILAVPLYAQQFFSMLCITPCFLEGTLNIEETHRAIIFLHKTWVVITLPACFILWNRQRLFWEILSLNMLFVPLPKISRWKSFGGGFSGGAGAGTGF